MWPVSRGDLVGLRKAQLALFLIVYSFFQRFLLFYAIFFLLVSGPPPFLDLVPSDHRARPVKMISFRDN